MLLKSPHGLVELEETEAVKVIGSCLEIRWKGRTLSGGEGSDLHRILGKPEPATIPVEGVRSPAVVLGEVPVTVASWLGKYEWMVRVVGNEDLHADVLNITVIDDASGMEGELQSVIDDLDLLSFALRI